LEVVFLFDFLGPDRQITKISNQIYFIPEQGMFDGNCYILGDPADALALIDTGNGFNTKSVLQKLTKIGVPLKQIQKLLLTHCHLDHIGGFYKLLKLLKQPFEVSIHEIEASVLEQGIKDIIVPIKDVLGPFIGGIAKSFINFKPFPLKVHNKLKDGDIIDVGGLQLRTIHTPGHSAGSCCFYEERLKVLFTGDTVFSANAVEILQSY
jgi:hydroxyacylglutathione hydrolase